MKSFTDYTLAELKDIARKYKEVTKLSFSRMKREELAAELAKHLEHDAKGELRLRKKVGLLGGYHAVATIHKAEAKARAEKEAVEKMERKKAKIAKEPIRDYPYSKAKKPRAKKRKAKSDKQEAAVPSMTRQPSYMETTRL